MTMAVSFWVTREGNSIYLYLAYYSLSLKLEESDHGQKYKKKIHKNDNVTDTTLWRHSNLVITHCLLFLEPRNHYDGLKVRSHVRPRLLVCLRLRQNANIVSMRMLR